MKLKSHSILSLTSAILTLASAQADCRPLYDAKLATLGGQATANRIGMTNFAGAAALSTAIGGPAAWAGSGALAISTGVHFAILKKQARGYREARALLDESRAGQGTLLSRLSKKLQKKVALSPAELADLVLRADNEDQFCRIEDGKLRLMKAGQIERWIVDHARLR